MNNLTFDDVLLVPQYSDIASRQDVSLRQTILGEFVDSPFIPANMDTVSGIEMVAHQANRNRYGILYRPAEQSMTDTLHMLGKIEKLVKPRCKMRYVIPSINLSAPDRYYNGMNADWYMQEFTDDLNVLGIDKVCIDIAHGHHLRMCNLIKDMKSVNRRKLIIIAGNVATFDGAYALATAGADMIKVGIGPGAACSTRIVTGHGVPQFSAIKSIKQGFDSLGMKNIIIADGGIRNCGDAAKAIAVGADLVMCGKLFSGTDQSPGKIMKKYFFFGPAYKIYRGMASFDAQKASNVKNPRVEGVSYTVPYQGDVENIFDSLHAGLRSACSYSGANSLVDFRKKAKIMEVSYHTLGENIPHGMGG